MKVVYIKDKKVLIDEEDLPLFLNLKWGINSNGYIRYNLWNKGIQKQIYFHREVLKAPKGKIVDHINGNKLDNRKANLRLCQHGENLRNCKKRKGNYSSKHKGVYYLTQKGRRKRWCVSLNLNKKKIHVGLFYTEKEAKKAYDEASLKYHEDFSYLKGVGK